RKAASKRPCCCPSPRKAVPTRAAQPETAKPHRIGAGLKSNKARSKKQKAKALTRRQGAAGSMLPHSAGALVLLRYIPAFPRPLTVLVHGAHSSIPPLCLRNPKVVAL